MNNMCFMINQCPGSFCRVDNRWWWRSSSSRPQVYTQWWLDAEPMYAEYTIMSLEQWEIGGPHRRSTLNRCGTILTM